MLIDTSDTKFYPICKLRILQCRLPHQILFTVTLQTDRSNSFFSHYTDLMWHFLYNIHCIQHIQENKNMPQHLFFPGEQCNFIKSKLVGGLPEILPYFFLHEGMGNFLVLS